MLTPSVADKVFSGASDDRLPNHVKKLSLAKREQWVGAWNGRFEKCREDGNSVDECEGSAFAVANAAVKGSEDKGYVESWDLYGRQISQMAAQYEPIGGNNEKACGNCRWYVAETDGCVLVSSYPEPILSNGISNRWEAKPDPLERDPLPVVIVGGSAEANADKASKREGGVEYQASDYASVPDREKPSGWKLRLAEGSSGGFTVAQVGRAITALQPSGFRGRTVELSTSERKSAISRISSAIGKISGADADQKSTLRERLDAVKTVTVQAEVPRDLLAKAKTTLLALLKRDQPAHQPAFQLFKDADGDIRWVARMSNRWRDRDNPPEIITEKAHLDYVAHVDETGEYPEAWLWHTPGTKWGQADWIDYADGFLLVSGTVDPGMEHVADSLAAAKDLGVSHGFRYRHDDEAAGIIGWYETFEVSPLTGADAANPWTSMEVLVKEMAMFTDRKRAFLVEHLGEADVARLENDTDGMKTALEAAGIEWKALEAVGDDPPAGAPATTPPIDLDALALKVGQQAVKALTESAPIVALQTEIKALGDRLTAVEKSDDEKIAAAVAAPLGGRAGHVASKVEGNVVLEGSPEAAAAIKGPHIFEHVMKDLQAAPEGAAAS